MELMESRVVLPTPLTWRIDGGHDQVVVLRNISWEQYDAIDRAKGDAPQPLLAYLDGDLELVTVSEYHERIKMMLGRLVDVFAEERGLRLDGLGQATLRDEAKLAGAEPDNWYRTSEGDGPPDLAIEVVFTHGGVDKLEIYRRLGAREVWFWVNGKLWTYHLVASSYVERRTSAALPGIDFDELERLVGASDRTTDQMAIVRAYRASLRRA